MTHNHKGYLHDLGEEFRDKLIAAGIENEDDLDELTKDYKQSNLRSYHNGRDDRPMHHSTDQRTDKGRQPDRKKKKFTKRH